MEHTILLDGTDYTADKTQIEENIKQGPVFLLDEPNTELYQYIDYLYEECGLKSKSLNRLRICKQVLFQGAVTLLSDQGDGAGPSPHHGRACETAPAGNPFPPCD